MIFELRSYEVLPGQAICYLEVFRAEGLPVISRFLDFLGFWSSEFGALNVVYSLWSHTSLSERRRNRAALYTHTPWTAGFVSKAFPLILNQRSLLLESAGVQPSREAVHAGGDFWTLRLSCAPAGDAAAKATFAFRILAGDFRTHMTLRSMGQGELSLKREGREDVTILSRADMSFTVNAERASG